MFKVGDKVKFKKSSVDTGMIDATENDVFTVGVGNFPSDMSKLIWITEHRSWYHANHFEHVKESVIMNTEEQEIKWEVGQEVWDVRFGRGEIVHLSLVDCYPVKVRFDKHAFESYYTLAGLCSNEDKNRSLYFSEPQIIAEKFPPKKPFVPVLKNGDRVLIKVIHELYGEGTVRTVYSEADDRIFISDDGIYFLKKDIESLYILNEEIKFNQTSV